MYCERCVYSYSSYCSPITASYCYSCSSQKKDKLYTSAALTKTTQLLDLNPEFYTVWNYRRHILLNGLFPASWVSIYKAPES